METFRFLLFGIAGVSVIFWVSVIALWHTYMFPTFFKEDKDLDSFIVDDKPNTLEPILGDLVKINTLKSIERVKRLFVSMMAILAYMEQYQNKFVD